MKLKFTLQRSAGAVDLLATVDSATTVGDLASYLARADPAAQTAPGSLSLVPASTGLAIDPRLPLVDSGLRSGATVSIIRTGAGYADPSHAAAAVVRVVAGPDEGREFQLPRGASVIGRDRGCEVRLSDPLVSRRHARLNVTDAVEIVDFGSANGLAIDDLVVARSVLKASDTVRLGDTTLSVRLLTTAPAERGGADTAIGFVRSPRLDPVYEGPRFEGPELPERPERHRFPLIPLIAPLLMGVLLYAVTRSMLSLVFIGLSPLMMIGNAVESALGGRAAYKRAVAEFRDDVASLVADVQTALHDESAARRREHPATVECLDAARHANPLLWTRRPGERGFAELRLGLGRLPSRSTIELPKVKRASRALFAELVERTAPLGAVDDVPVVAALAESALGIGGPRELALPVARAIVSQLVTLHSPAELVLAAVASTASAREWDWLKWLPHASSSHSPVPVGGLAATAAGGTALVSELEALVEARADARSGGPAAAPAVVLLVESDTPVEHSRLVALAERGAEHGVHVVWVAAEVASLPAACATFVEMGRDPALGSAGFVHTATEVTPLAVETLDEVTAGELAHRLAPLVDVGARTDDASDLPRSVSLLALTGTDLADGPEAVIERWTQNRSIITGPLAPPTPPRHAGTLRAVIGQSASQPHALDLRSDGPHALVGGTTGAGKSELLQAWILAMAAAHSPHRLSFLLVDYKGGSAFRDCVDLPHTVGLVTDLSPHLVRRALISLSAELTYREHVLAKHHAKDLVTLEKQGIAEAPPSLVIVVDEFAALVNEVPEFVDGVVNVAQRGRSLGLHLILATQRPAGVIKDNLRANTNLRLALRMADEEDSSDVLGSPQAAFFDPAIPGRAVSKTGPGRLVPFQTAYAGGWTSDEPEPPEILVEELTFGVGTAWALPEPTEAGEDDLGPTDIRRLVSSVNKASALAQIAPPRKPWLPELRAVYDLSDRSLVPTRRSDTELVFGVGDDPDNQAQPAVAFHPDREGNLAVYGTGGSGKSTLLRSLAIAAGFTVRGGPCHVYGIDFGARGLAILEDLPHVGSIINGGEHERITRLLARLRALIDDRAARYSRARAGTITDYRRLANVPDEPRILLLIDGIAAFRQAYESTDRLRWFDMLTSIAADGRQVGVHVVLSSDQRGAVPVALASAVQSRLVMRMASADDYGMLGVPSDVLTATSPPGRCLLGDREIQVAVLVPAHDDDRELTPADADVTSQARAVKAFAAAMHRSGAQPAEAIGSLPETVHLDALPATRSDRPVIGIGSSDLGPYAIDPRGSFLVCGPPGSGRTNALRVLARALVRSEPSAELYYFGPHRSALASMDVWRRRASGAEAADLASTLAAELPMRAASDRPVAVFIEGIGDFVNGPADMALQDLAKVCLAEDAFLVAEGETSTLGSSYGLLGFAKSNRSGIALAPDQQDGASIFRTNFPRIDRAEYPPGRALAVARGKAEVMQVALMPGE